MTKYLSTYKIQQKKTHCIVLCNIFYKTNNFLIVKIEVKLLLAKPINKKKSLYTDIFNKKDPTNNDKKILDKKKVSKISEIKFITPENKHIICTLSKLDIQFIQSKFKLI